MARTKRAGRPATAAPTSPPRRRRNAEIRSREHLTPAEVEAVARAAAKIGRHGPRDALLIRLAYRHGLRVSELVRLRWEQVDFAGGLLHVQRSKRGTPSTHPLGARETRELRRWRRPPTGRSSSRANALGP